MTWEEEEERGGDGGGVAGDGCSTRFEYTPKENVILYHLWVILDSKFDAVLRCSVFCG